MISDQFLSPIGDYGGHPGRTDGRTSVCILVPGAYVYLRKPWGDLLAPAVTVGETEGAMDSTSVFLPLLLPITL